MPLQTPVAQSGARLARRAVVRAAGHLPVIVETGCGRISGMQLLPRMHGPSVPQSESFVHTAPPGWLQKPCTAGQSLSVAQLTFAFAEQRRFAGLPPG